MRTLIKRAVQIAACAAGIVMLVAAGGCDFFHNNDSPSTVANTETFSGSLAQGGSVIFTFAVSKAGAVNVTLTSMTPSSTAGVSLGIGTPSGSACAVTASTSSVVAGSSAQLTTTQDPGNYCVKVSDGGALTAATTVTVTVTHS